MLLIALSKILSNELLSKHKTKSLVAYHAFLGALAFFPLLSVGASITVGLTAAFCMPRSRMKSTHKRDPTNVFAVRMIKERR